MPIISVEIMKTIDEREKQRTKKEKQTKTEWSKGYRSYSERVRAKWFCCEKVSKEMNTSRKAMEWLTCFSMVNLMLGCLIVKSS